MRVGYGLRRTVEQLRGCPRPTTACTAATCVERGYHAVLLGRYLRADSGTVRPVNLREHLTVLRKR